MYALLQTDLPTGLVKLNRALEITEGDFKVAAVLRMNFVLIRSLELGKQSEEEEKGYQRRGQSRGDVDYVLALIFT